MRGLYIREHWIKRFSSITAETKGAISWNYPPIQRLYMRRSFKRPPGLRPDTGGS